MRLRIQKQVNRSELGEMPLSLMEEIIERKMTEELMKSMNIPTSKTGEEILTYEKDVFILHPSQVEHIMSMLKLVPEIVKNPIIDEIFNK